MIAVLILAAALWWLGRLFGASREARLILLALLYVGVLALLVVLPDAHPLRLRLGGSVAVWLVLGGAGLIVWGYAKGIAHLKARSIPAPIPAATTPAPAPDRFAPEELERYSRHILLREIGGPGQRRLRDAHVLVVGAGGLGAPALLYLAAAGVGRITVIDDDRVELSNLQRQVIHPTASLGLPKAASAAAAMAALNPHCRVEPVEARLDDRLAQDFFAKADLILDGSDTFATRTLVNRAAVAARVPLLSAAISQWEGQISLFDPARGAPCLACLFPEEPAPGLAPTCAEAGVAAPLPGVIGSLMALEAVKELTGAGQGLRGRLLIWDGLWGETRTIAIRRRPGCPVCGQARE